MAQRFSALEHAAKNDLDAGGVLKRLIQPWLCLRLMLLCWYSFQRALPQLGCVAGSPQASGSRSKPCQLLPPPPHQHGQPRPSRQKAAQDWNGSTTITVLSHPVKYKDHHIDHFRLLLHLPGHPGPSEIGIEEGEEGASEDPAHGGDFGCPQSCRIDKAGVGEDTEALQRGSWQV
ncbi:hypothetical protein D623_10001028 [Myotis brandtii]|uniref:Uncharacterized protein n=1 Tax=Myotis brandtii TaxID=109478 RepID=S7PMY2_MYOBR|nr:hypothetical protein D623_10001028 [Myotis brandtii]